MTLTQEMLRKVIHYDPATGQFTWLKIGNTNGFAGKVAGSLDQQGYRRISVYSRFYKAHRLAWLYIHGVWPEPEIDHINRIRDDNRIENLRVADRLLNMRNTARWRKEAA
jgi:hypothetical protein